MNFTCTLKLYALGLCCAMAFTSLKASAEDTDIFVASSTGAAGAPNLLIILDNTTNWVGQNQRWPSKNNNGNFEALAIKDIIDVTNYDINIGLMMYPFNAGGADGGFIRQAVLPMNNMVSASNVNNSAFRTKLDVISNDINGNPNEAAASNRANGAIMFDAYKYFGGYTSPAHTGDNVAGTPTDATHYGTTPYATPASVPVSYADPAGYTSASFTAFAPPSANSCSKNYIIYIGNGFPSGVDDPTLLSNIGCDPSLLPRPVINSSSTSDATILGTTGACYPSQAACTSGAPELRSTGGCPGSGTNIYDTCTCTTAVSACGAGKNRYTYVGNVVTTTTSVSSTTAIPTGAAAKNLSDVWARCLYQTDVGPAAGQQNITTYTIDVYNANPDPNQNALLYNMAKYGGGKYFTTAGSGALSGDGRFAVRDAIRQIITEIQGVNSTFASASLPVNATNRSQNENQVFIGMFRPDPQAQPRWFGNLKRYQLINTGPSIELGDLAGNLATNNLTGFIADCASSWWTIDSGNYWGNVSVNPNPAGRCATTAYNAYSDAPDGSMVEKGAAAEVLRRGNNPPTTDTTPTWAVNRTIYTLSSAGLLVPFNSTNVTSISANAVNFTRGKDVNNEKNYTGLITPLPAEPTRPSLHGDVIHSRPLPVNYGGATGVTVYYGANDGALRAVEAGTGKERWAFVAPETFASLPRLMDNSPLVNYPNLPAGILPTPTSKNYFFDGSIGLYQDATSANVSIYPTMRRGGRMIYSFDVANPAIPAFKWKVGCPNLGNDTGCTAGMAGIGQTWSIPNVAFIKGYSTSVPIIVVGGGYDACEDNNSATPPCATPKGAGVYVLNASTGAVIASFPTTRSVPADAALIDIDSDGNVDYAYAADTGGNIYRIDFVDTARSPQPSTGWAIHRVAYTNGAGRKFMYAPALLASGGKVYLAIGSGDREHPLQTQYPYAGVTNRFYVYLDDLAASVANNLDDATKFSDLTTNPSCTGISLLSSGMKGWFMNLNQYGQGEQTVTSAVIAGGMATFSTNRPIPTPALSCSNSLGEARGYWVNLLTGSGAVGVAGSCGGTRSATFIGGGLPPSPVMGSVPIGGKQTTVVIGAVRKTGGSSSPIAPQQVKPAISSKRKIIYWKSSGDN